MQNPVLSSTAFLTALLAVGLFFFIRASAKDRTQIAKLATQQQEESLFEQIQHYFTQRSYRIAAVDAEHNQVTFEGFVRPSWFLAVFLTMLAAIGIFCLSLVLSFVLPQAANLLPLLVMLAPVAGIFYWKKAGRQEQVFLRIEPYAQLGTDYKSLLTVTAHRDELAEIQRILELEPVEP